MLKSKTRWIVRESIEDKAETLMNELKITPFVASMLVNRGLDTVDTARYFLFGQDSFHDPYLLKGMDAAVARIRKAIELQEPILVFGDYDADGVSSTVVLMTALRDLGANAQYYIPNRFTEGYGPNEPAFRAAADNGVRLIITVDTGISALHEAAIAKEIGVDLIITDHHEPGPQLPEALAIIHPKLEDSIYPFKELAGVGVAFKLAHALYGELPEHLLEIAVIGTIADLVSLKDENRTIAKRGIEKLKGTQNIGLKAILKRAGVDMTNISEETIGFTIGPRINAVGRLENADMAVELLLTNDRDEAEALAEEMENLNKERQNIVNTITAEAIEMVERDFPVDQNKVLVIGKAGWNAGVIGIVASRLVDRFYRPTIVLSFDEEKGLAKGSARSIEGFDLFKNLSLSRDILPHFGGHPMAAGMTLELANVPELRSRLNELCGEQLTEKDFVPVTMLDGEISLKDINLSSLAELNLLAPYGMDNPKPKILIRDADISSMRKIGSEQNHLKLALADEGNVLDGIGFGLGPLLDQISQASKVSVIGELSINEWNNIRKPQIFIKDAKVETWQLFDYRGVKRLKSVLDTMPSPSTFIFFHKQNVEKYAELLEGEVHLLESEKDATDLEMDDSNIVLMDMPPSKAFLTNLFLGKKPARIYALFLKEESDYFSTIPTREHFRWFYAFLSKNSPFDLKSRGDDLAKHKGWSSETVKFMSKVFFELDFVTIKNGLISLNKEASKRDLTDSPTYQHKQEQYSLENDLLYSSFTDLKQLFEQIFQVSVENEEAIEEWI
ncbi:MULTISPECIES: single-stranded-DNA-specific exonuclease RecJ [unclassified Bacillus (in: firmicutes)]|uniref:single-stranded-DNA-specific exonuclease RecJ n=1 Tax=unclassified Bacillus (in: firmicutes) TaxID=185979 RepID=UPI0008E46DF9|nr:MULTISPECIES: single-stranded-DNA-specific exonuclease RecJ [unclassified Bacillus (in: firmicutes)]SFA94652.1 single-stranded-DNA-specific exonuclease [Bacillus sp. UNCCL13]SFQ78542.1 single-stranded-DNA-specific exonuclease [Bacillus sp. cl95]